MADYESEPTTYILPADARTEIILFFNVDATHFACLEYMRNLIEPRCEGFNHFQAFHQELAWIGREMFPREVQDLLSRTDLFKGSRNQTPEEKREMLIRRGHISALRSTILRLQRYIYPSMTANTVSPSASAKKRGYVINFIIYVY
jgi:hypothetical protein